MPMTHAAQIPKGIFFLLYNTPPPPKKKDCHHSLFFVNFSHSALPSHDPDEINKDIKSVDDWIQKNKDEL